MEENSSVFTISVAELIEQNFDFGLEHYEIFDEGYREILNKKILDYYMFHEIGYINPAKFRFRLNERMNRIMHDKYNDLYKAKMTEFNLLNNVDMKETFTHTVEDIGKTISDNVAIGESTVANTSKENSTSNNVSSDTTNNNSKLKAYSSSYPSEEMSEGELDSNIYLDGATHTDGEDNNTSTSEQELINTSNSDVKGNTKESNTIKSATDNNSKRIETYERTNVGSSAGLPFSRALVQYADYIDRYEIDKMIIKELSSLFFTVW